jgi:cell division protein FtsQ
VTRPGTRRRPARAAGRSGPGPGGAPESAAAPQDDAVVPEPPPDAPEVAEAPGGRSMAAVYRRRRRLGLLLLVVVLLVGLGLTARVLLYDVGLADVDRVDLTVTAAGGAPVGAGGVPALLSEQQLRDAAAVPLGGPLISVDTGAVADRLRALPAVASVEVERDWPHGVALHVVQRTPVAAVQTATGPAMVDATGVVIAGPAAPGLPGLAVATPGPADPATLAGVAVLAALPQPVRGQVLTATVTASPGGGPAQVELGLGGSKEVHWGSAERSAEKAAVLVPLLSQPGRIYDVTSPDLPTITR